MKQPTQPWIGLGVFIFASFAVAAVASAFTSTSVSGWYTTLHKPTWSPPNWVFGPVWSILYLTMALGAWLVWRRHGWPGARWALGCYAVQLLLNAAWPALFFGLRSPSLAFVEIALLWLLVLITLALFWRVVVAAGLLFLPYFLWVTYAAALNFAFWRLNS